MITEDDIEEVDLLITTGQIMGLNAALRCTNSIAIPMKVLVNIQKEINERVENIRINRPALLESEFLKNII